jgi:hypothetical protein
MPRKISKARLDQMVEEATVDAYGESEQTTGLYTLLEEHLELPFRTKVLEVEVTVEKLDLTDAEEIVVVCRRGKTHQRLPILDLPLPRPPPEGWEWIEAYRHWARGWR